MSITDSDLTKRGIYDKYFKDKVSWNDFISIYSWGYDGGYSNGNTEGYDNGYSDGYDNGFWNAKESLVEED